MRITMTITLTITLRTMLLLALLEFAVAAAGDNRGRVHVLTEGRALAFHPEGTLDCSSESRETFGQPFRRGHETCAEHGMKSQGGGRSNSSRRPFLLAISPFFVH